MADLIIFMEKWHKAKAMYLVQGKNRFLKTDVLEIPDEYGYMDDELTKMIKLQVDYLLNYHFGIEPVV